MTYVFGLPHKFSIKRPNSETTDEAGGIQVAYAWIFQDRDCRVSVLTGEDITKWQGLDGKGEWQVVCEYSPELTDADIFVLGSDSPAPAGDYQIIKYKHHIDQDGAYDHTNLILGKFS